MGTVKKLIFSKMGFTILHENDPLMEPPAEKVIELKNTDIVEYTNTNINEVQRKTDTFNIDMIVNNDIVLKDIQHIPVNAQVSVVGDDENMCSLEINKTKTDENRDCNGEFDNLFDRNFVVDENKDGIIEHEITANADVGLIKDDNEDTVEIDFEIEEVLLREIEEQEKLKYDLNADNRSNGRKPNFGTEDWGFEVRIEDSIKQDKKLVGNAVVNLVRIDETDAFQTYLKNNSINVRHAKLYTGTDDKNLTISMTDKETIIKAESNTAELNDTTYIDSENITVGAKEIELTGSIKPENTEKAEISDDENINPTAENTELTNSITINSPKLKIETDAEEIDLVEPAVIPSVKIRKQSIYKSHDLISELDVIPETIFSNPYKMEAVSRISDDEYINPTAENTELTNSITINSPKLKIETDAEEIDLVEPAVIPPVKIRKQSIYKSHDLISELDVIPETIFSNPYEMEAVSRISDDEYINPTAENTELTNSITINSPKLKIETDAEEIDLVEPAVIPPVKIRKQSIYKSHDLISELDVIPETIFSNPYEMEAVSRISDDEYINPTAENTELTNSITINSPKLKIETDAEEIDLVEPAVIPPVKIRKQSIYKSHDLISELDVIPETIFSNPYEMEAVSRISDDEYINPTAENTELTNSLTMNSAKPMIKTDAEDFDLAEPEAIPPVKVRKQCIYKSYDLIPALDVIPETILSNPYNMEALTLIKPVVVRLKESDRLQPRRVVRKLKLPYIDEDLRTNKGILTAKVPPIRIRKCLSAWESYTPDLQEHTQGNCTYLVKKVKRIVKKLLKANAAANRRLKNAERKFKRKHNKQNKRDDKKKKKEKKKMKKKKSSETILDHPRDELNRERSNNDIYLTTGNINTSLKETRDASKTILNSREPNNGYENYQKKRCEKRKISDVIEWEKHKRKLQKHFNASDIHKSSTKTKDKRKVCNVESGVNQKDLNVFEYHTKYRKRKLKNKRFDTDPIKEWETQKSKIKNLAAVSTSDIKTSLPTEKQNDSSVPIKEEKHTRDYLEEWEAQKKHFGMDDPNDTLNKQICSVDPGNALKELTPCAAKQSNNRKEKKTLKDKERKKTENQKEQQAKKNSTRNPLEEWEIEKNKYKKYFTIGDFGKSEPKKLPQTTNKINETSITELKLMQEGSKIDSETRNNTTFNKGDVNSTSEPTKPYNNALKLVQESSQICFQNGNITFNIEAVNKAPKALIQDKTELKMVQAGSQTDAKKEIQATFNENNVNKTSEAVRQDKVGRKELEVVQEGSQDAEKKNMILNICDANRISKAIQQERCQIDSEKENITFDIYDVNGTTEAVRQDKNKWKLLLQGSQIDPEKRNNMTINLSDVSRTSEAVRQDKIELKLMEEGSKLDFEKRNVAFKTLCDVNRTSEAVRQDKIQLKLMQEGSKLDFEKGNMAFKTLCDVNRTSEAVRQDKIELKLMQEGGKLDFEKGNKAFKTLCDVNRTSEAVRQDKIQLKLMQEGSKLKFEKGNMAFKTLCDVNRTSEAVRQDKIELKLMEEGSKLDLEKGNMAFKTLCDVNRTSEVVSQDKTELKLVQDGRPIDPEKRINTLFNICDVNRISKAIQQERCQIDSEKENITFDIYDVNGTTEAVRQDKNKWKLLLQGSQIDPEKRNMTINLCDVSRTSEAVRQDKIQLKLMQEGSKLDFEKGNMAFKTLCDVNRTSEAVRQDKIELKLMQEGSKLDFEKGNKAFKTLCDVNRTSEAVRQDKIELKLMQEGSKLDFEKGNKVFKTLCDVNRTSEAVRQDKIELKLMQEGGKLDFEKGNKAFKTLCDVNRTSEAVRQDKIELKLMQEGSKLDFEKGNKAFKTLCDVNRTSEAVRQDKIELKLMQEGSKLDFEKGNKAFKTLCDVNRTSEAVRQDKIELKLMQEGSKLDFEKGNMAFKTLCDVNRTSEAVRQDKIELKLMQEGSKLDFEKGNMAFKTLCDVNRTSEAVRQDKIELKLMEEGSKLDLEKGNMAFKTLCDVNRTSEVVSQDKTELKLVQDGRPIDPEKRINTLFNIYDVNSTSKAIQDKFKLNMAQEECEMGSEKGNMTFNIGDVRVNRTSPPTRIGTERWSTVQASSSLGRAPHPAVGRYNCNPPNRTFITEHRRLITPDRRGSIEYLNTNTSVHQNCHKECTNITQKPTPSQILFHPTGTGREGNEIDLLIDEMNIKMSGLCGSRERHHILDPFLKNGAALDANGCAYVKPLESIKEKSILQKNKMLVSMLERKQPVLESPKKSVDYLEDISFQKKNPILPSFEPQVNSNSKQHVLEVPEKPLDLSKDKSLEKLKPSQPLLAQENSGISSAGTHKPSSDQTKQSTLKPSKFTAYPKDPSLEKLQTLRHLLLSETNVKKTISPRKDNTSRD